MQTKANVKMIQHVFLFSNIIIRLEKHFRVEENMLAYNLPSNVVSLSKYLSTTTMHKVDVSWLKRLDLQITLA